MPEDPSRYARALAAVLLEEYRDKIVVDLHNESFVDEVATILEELGCRVERDKPRPNTMTVHRAPPKRIET